MRKAELICGLLAGFAGLLGLGYALFGPTGDYAVSEVTSDGRITMLSGRESLWASQWPFEPITLVFFLAVVLALAGVVLGAVVHSRDDFRPARLLLWVSTGMLVAMTLVGVVSIGVFLLPATLFSLAAAIVAGARTSAESTGAPGGA